MDQDIKMFTFYDILNVPDSLHWVFKILILTKWIEVVTCQISTLCVILGVLFIF